MSNDRLDADYARLRAEVAKDRELLRQFRLLKMGTSELHQEHLRQLRARETSRWTRFLNWLKG